MGYTFLASLVQEKNKYCIKILLASLKTLNNSENSTERESNFFNSFPFLSLVDFLLCEFMAGFRNNFRITGSFHANFRITGFYQKDGTSFQKRVAGKIFTVSK